MNLDQLKRFVTKVRPFAGAAVLLLTVGLFYRYLKTHPSTLTPLKHVHPSLIAAGVVLYFGVLCTNFLVTTLTIQVCGHRLRLLETIQLTLYSTIANFFGPLQSGPGVRALYLKKRVGLKIRDYTLASLAYYLYFAFLSFFILIAPKFPILLVLLPIGILVGWLIVKKIFGKVKSVGRFYLLIGLVTLGQVVFNAAIYGLELRSSSQVSLAQVLAYTGSANFALFVSLTPAAVGIRESFLYFSRRIHHIATGVILSASVLDRAIYLVFLLAVFGLTSSLHLREKITKVAQVKDS